MVWRSTNIRLVCVLLVLLPVGVVLLRCPLSVGARLCLHFSSVLLLVFVFRWCATDEGFKSCITSRANPKTYCRRQKMLHAFPAGVLENKNSFPCANFQPALVQRKKGEPKCEVEEAGKAIFSSSDIEEGAPIICRSVSFSHTFLVTAAVLVFSQFVVAGVVVGSTVGSLLSCRKTSWAEKVGKTCQRKERHTRIHSGYEKRDANVSKHCGRNKRVVNRHRSSLVSLSSPSWFFDFLFFFGYG